MTYSRWKASKGANRLPLLYNCSARMQAGPVCGCWKLLSATYQGIEREGWPLRSRLASQMPWAGVAFLAADMRLEEHMYVSLHTQSWQLCHQQLQSCWIEQPITLSVGNCSWSLSKQFNVTAGCLPPPSAFVPALLRRHAYRQQSQL